MNRSTALVFGVATVLTVATVSHAQTAQRAPVRVGDSPPSMTGGRIDAAVVTRIVRQNMARFRLCYENGLRTNPNLQGRVNVRFVIGVDGAVSRVGHGGNSTMPNQGVLSCVVRAFNGLSFPRPQGGEVTVVYPVNFAPGA